MVDEAAQLAELDRLQADYRKAVDEWVEAIRKEEALASVNHNVAEVDQVGGGVFREYPCARRSGRQRPPTRTPCAGNSIISEGLSPATPAGATGSPDISLLPRRHRKSLAARKTGRREHCPR